MLKNADWIYWESIGQFSWGRKLTRRAKLVPEALVVESNRLRAAWMRHDLEILDKYLITDVEDPRINLQSILSRSFLIDSIWPDEFTWLIREEFRFSICLNFILKFFKNNGFRIKREVILDALVGGLDRCCGTEIPSYIRDSFDLICNERNEFPNYIRDAFIDGVLDESGLISEPVLSTFEQIWNDVLFDREGSKISVLEPACGSANDYRYLDSYGISSFLDYTGFDICDKNIANAHGRFTCVDFKIGNIIDIPVEDNSYDFLFVHDLFEHLSPAAINWGLGEICRVTRKQACLSFFNMDDINEHIIEPMGLYHWNTLSLNKIAEILKELAYEVDVIHIDSFLRENYNCGDYHNPKAYTLIVSFDG